MSSEYIQAVDYSTFGLPVGTTAVQVKAASAVVDGFLQRSMGCVYTVSLGQPTAMAATGQPIIEEREFPARGHVQLSCRPVARIFDVEQRWDGAWKSILIGPASFEADGGLWLDSSLLCRPMDRSTLRITYIAGWLYSALPAAIQQAVANIINFAAEADMPGNIKKLRAGDTEIERFDDTAMDGDTRAMLAQYKRVFA